MQPFQHIPEESPVNESKSHAFRYIYNFLATANSPDELRNTDFDTVLAGVNSYPYEDELVEIYKEYLLYCLDDRKLVPEEIRVLLMLKRFLGLREKVTRDATNEIVTQIYTSELEKVLEDGVVTEEEKSFLEDLRENLFITQDTAEALYQTKAKQYIEGFIQTIVADDRLTPEEETQLQDLVESLNLTIDIGDSNRRVLEECKIYWLIENGQLPVVRSRVELYEGEECHFEIPNVYLYSFEDDQVQDNKLSFIKRGQVAKAISLLLNDKAIRAIDTDHLVYKDNGAVFLTSARIILETSMGIESISLPEIRQFEVYGNGIELSLKSEPNIFLVFEKHLKLAAMLLNRMMAG